MAHADNTLLQYDGLKASGVMHPLTSQFGLQPGSRWDYKRSLSGTEFDNHLLLYFAKPMRCLDFKNKWHLYCTEMCSLNGEDVMRPGANELNYVTGTAWIFFPLCFSLFFQAQFNYTYHPLKHLQVCSLAIRYMHVFRMILTINSDYIPKQH
jgi:hypothetical protein